MLKRLPFYPFLFALYAVLAPLALNLEQLDLSQSRRPLLWVLLVTAAGMLLFYALSRDWQYAAYLSLLLLVYIFVFGYLNRELKSWDALPRRPHMDLYLLGAWTLLLSLLAIPGLWRRLGGRIWMTQFFNVFSSVAVALALVFNLPRFLSLTTQARAFLDQSLAPTRGMPLNCSNRPDIYYLVLDAYGRADVLERMYQFDNHPFLDYLKSKGFYVVEEAHSNYIQTVFSIPATLNFDYLPPPPPGVNGLQYFTGLVKENNLMAALKQCGYRTVAFESGFTFTNDDAADRYLFASRRLDQFESLLLADSPLQVLAGELHLQLSQFTYEAHRQRVLYSFQTLAELPRMPGPKVVFAHIISPHPPFVFDGMGRPVLPRWGYFIGDGNDYPGTLEEYRAGYAAQVQFVNRNLERVIDAILEESPQPPVIVIMGDHGPGSLLDWSSPQRTCLWERASILNAYYLPGEGSSRLFPSITPVNSFRVVLDAYFGADLKMLPDHTYFTSARLEHQVIDITAERSSLDNCKLESPSP